MAAISPRILAPPLQLEVQSIERVQTTHELFCLTIINIEITHVSEIARGGSPKVKKDDECSMMQLICIFLFHARLNVNSTIRPIKRFVSPSIKCRQSRVKNFEIASLGILFGLTVYTIIQRQVLRLSFYAKYHTILQRHPCSF
jgi:hypothetical protein